jgi:hypothetical protein
MATLTAVAVAFTVVARGGPWAQRGAVWVACAVVWAVDPGRGVAWTPEDYQPLQEADSATAARLAVGDGAHGGPMWQAFLASFASAGASTGPRYADLLALDVRLGLIAAILLAAALDALASSLAREDRAARIAAWILPFAPTAWAWVAGRSEGPAAGAWVGLSAALLAATAPTGRARVGALLAWSAWLGFVRVELAAPPLVLLVWPWVVRGARRLPRWLWVALAVVWAGWSSATSFKWVDTVTWGAAGWAANAASAADPSVAFLPLLALAMLGPRALFAVGGAGIAVRGGEVLAGAAVGVALLARLYWASGHGPLLGRGGFVSTLEQVRYLAPTLPWILALVWRGWTASPGWLRGVGALALAVPGLPAALLVWPDSTSARWSTPGISAMGHLDRDLQREVRLMAALRDAHPDCALVAWEPDGWTVVPPVTAGRSGRPTSPPAGWGLAQVAEAAAQTTPGGCVGVLSGLSCARPALHLAPGSVAASVCAPQGPELATASWDEAPYAHPAHRWLTTPQVTVSVWAWTPTP